MVIQRWQSILLLAACVMMACFTFCQLGQVQTTDYSFSFTSLGFKYLGEPTGGAPTGMYMNSWYFFTLSITTSLLYLIDIFLYGNLSLQKKVCVVAIMMTIASASVAACLGYTAIDNCSISWTALCLSPFIAVSGGILAWNRITSDQNKLKAVDRIR